MPPWAPNMPLVFIEIRYKFGKPPAAIQTTDHFPNGNTQNDFCAEVCNKQNVQFLKTSPSDYGIFAEED